MAGQHRTSVIPLKLFLGPTCRVFAAIERRIPHWMAGWAEWNFFNLLIHSARPTREPTHRPAQAKPTNNGAQSLNCKSKLFQFRFHVYYFLLWFFVAIPWRCLPSPKWNVNYYRLSTRAATPRLEGSTLHWWLPRGESLAIDLRELSRKGRKAGMQLGRKWGQWNKGKSS